MVRHANRNPRGYTERKWVCGRMTGLGSQRYRPVMFSHAATPPRENAPTAAPLAVVCPRGGEQRPLLVLRSARAWAAANPVAGRPIGPTGCPAQRLADAAERIGFGGVHARSLSLASTKVISM